jgi:hypothetical protein
VSLGNPSLDLGRVEADEVPDLEEWDPALEDQPADESLADRQVLSDASDVEQGAHDPTTTL